MNRQDATSAKGRQGRLHPADIQIGEDEWIRFVELQGEPYPAVNLDRWIKPLEPFFAGLEVECVAACCGVEAFSFLPGHIREAASHYKSEDLERRLAELRDYTRSLDGDSVVSSAMNQYFDRQVFVQLVEHLLASVRRMPIAKAMSN